MNIEIGRRPKSLDQRDRAAVGSVSLAAGLIQQVARDHAVHDLQLWVRSEVRAFIHREPTRC